MGILNGFSAGAVDGYIFVFSWTMIEWNFWIQTRFVSEFVAIPAYIRIYGRLGKILLYFEASEGNEETSGFMKLLGYRRIDHTRSDEGILIDIDVDRKSLNNCKQLSVAKISELMRQTNCANYFRIVVQVRTIRKRCHYGDA